MLSTTETAKAIRSYLKDSGIKPLSVRSSTYSMGSSVYIEVDLETYRSRPLEFWRDLMNDYSYGSFDGMTDSYNYSPHTVVWKGEQVRPGAKYVHVAVRHDS
jgi:hypothetical protein